MKQAHVFYTGIVQGVGFRYTVREIAVRFGLKGWVKNLPDGRVESCIEGEESFLEQFFREVERRFEGHITNTDIVFSPTVQQFHDFKIII